MTATPWQESAPCKGLTHLFFAPHYEKPQARAVRLRQVRAMCSTCPFARPCQAAGADEAFGAWGGVSHDGKWRRESNPTAERDPGDLLVSVLTRALRRLDEITNQQEKQK